MASPSLEKWKEKAATAAERARKTAKAGSAQIAELRKKNAAKLREKTEQTRMAQTMGIVGAHATSVVAGQVTRELGIKRQRPGLARGINYAGGVLGAVAAIYGKSSGLRNAGAALTGMSIYQVGADTAQYDLVPGFNEEMGG